jgi:hypothetical protein
LEAPMRTALFFALLAAPLAAPAQAACQGDEAFSCQVGKKTLEICYWKGMLTYRFGPEGKPELTLNEPLETVDFMPWPGIGRAIWDSVVFENKGVAYEVWSSFDKLDENAVMEGGVNVMRDAGHTVLRQGQRRARAGYAQRAEGGDRPVLRP